jgi:hypothetical protein
MLLLLQRSYVLESDVQATSSSDPEPVDIIDD